MLVGESAVVASAENAGGASTRSMDAGCVEINAGLERAVDASEETEVRLGEVTKLGVRSEPMPLEERIEAERGLDDDVTSMSVVRRRETWDDCDEIETRLLFVSRRRRT